MFSARDEYWMQQAIEHAKKAATQGEVPVGAVLVRDDVLVSAGSNSSITSQDPTAHAEIIALRKGAEKLGNYRLTDSVLYVTLEPCMMCAGAIVHARIKRLVHGTHDPKSGAIVSQARVLDADFLNHSVEYQSGLFAKECGELLSNFFAARRQKNHE